MARCFLEGSLGNGQEAVAHGERGVELALEAGEEYLASIARNDLAGGLQFAALEADPADTRNLERAPAISVAALDEVRSFGGRRNTMPRK